MTGKLVKVSMNTWWPVNERMWIKVIAEDGDMLYWSLENNSIFSDKHVIWSTIYCPVDAIVEE